jgi:hypothetical protein
MSPGDDAISIADYLVSEEQTTDVPEDIECLAGDQVLFSRRDKPPPPPMPLNCHPMAQVIRRLWDATRGVGVLELCLEGGDTLSADAFSSELSQHDYGVFAIPEHGQRRSVLIIPWEQVTRATLTGLDDLPNEFFP